MTLITIDFWHDEPASLLLSLHQLLDYLFESTLSFSHIFSTRLHLNAHCQYPRKEYPFVVSADLQAQSPGDVMVTRQRCTQSVGLLHLLSAYVHRARSGPERDGC